MHKLAFSHAHSSEAAERAGLEPKLIRAVLTEPRQNPAGRTYDHVVWVAEIKRTDNISGDVKRLTRVAKRDNKGVEFDTSVPTAWLTRNHAHQGNLIINF